MGDFLHAVLALNPGGHVSAPGQGTAEGAQDVVPLDPFTGRDGTGFLSQQLRLKDRVTAREEKDQTQGTEQATGHLGHDGAQDGGRGILTFPVGFFGLQSRGRQVGRGHESRAARGSGLDKGLGRQGEKGAEDKGELGHVWMRYSRAYLL